MILTRLPRVFSLLLVLSGVAAAQQDVVKLAERLNQKALEDYDALEFDSARQTLLSAVAKLRDAGQDETPTAAKVYVSLGMVYISGLKDRNRGVQQFVEALKIDGTVQLDPEHATPELQEAFDEAVKQAGPSKKKEPAPPVEEETAPAKKGEVHGLQHNSVDEARVGQDVAIKAQLGSDVSASRLFLFYRGGGQEDYISVPMTVGGNGDWVGTIPGDAVQGRTVQYYIEARDSRGRPAVASGSAASPYIISVTGEDLVDKSKCPPGSECREEDPLAFKRKKAQPPAQERGYGRLFANLMIGTGVGVEFAGNKYEIAYQYNKATTSFLPLAVDSSGGAMSPLHGALELGVNITKHIGVSLIGRLEFTLINNADSTDGSMAPANANTGGGLGPGNGVAKQSLAPAGMVRFRYSFLEGRLRPFVHVGVGGGQIRHVLSVSGAEGMDAKTPLVDQSTSFQYTGTNPYDPKQWGQPPKLNEICLDHSNCTDNIAIGFVLVGAGGGLYYDLMQWHNGGFGLLLDIDAVAAFGDQTGINFDFQLGVGVHFL